MSEWQDISTPPPDGTVVVVYRGDVEPRSPLGPVRDFVERCDVGWYQDGCWWESGTGHDMFEDWSVEMGHAPTLWMELKPPQHKGREK